MMTSHAVRFGSVGDSTLQVRIVNDMRSRVCFLGRIHIGGKIHQIVTPHTIHHGGPVFAEGPFIPPVVPPERSPEPVVDFARSDVHTRHNQSVAFLDADDPWRCPKLWAPEWNKCH